MRIIYNGVDLLPIETHEMDIQPVYDDSGTDYLYSRFTASVRALVCGQAILSPSATFLGIPIPAGLSPQSGMSYAWTKGQGNNLDGNPDFRPGSQPVPNLTLFGGNPINSAGMDRQTPSPIRSIQYVENAPPLTHQTIRHRLSTPRGKLFVFSGPGIDIPGSMPPAPIPNPPGGRPTTTANNTRGGFKQDGSPSNSNRVLMMLEAPEEDALCDCRNGPLPRVFGVHSVHGDAGSFLVDWSIEAYINEGQLNLIDPTGALVSNRFSQSHSVDEDGFVTIITQGKAIYRTDRLFTTNSDGTPRFINPDSQRPVIFMPIMQGFVRENINVVGLENVTGVAYRYQDRQVHVNFPAAVYCGASSISAVHLQSIISDSDMYGALIKLYEDMKPVRRQSEEEDDRRDQLRDLMEARKRGQRRVDITGDYPSPPKDEDK